MSAADAAAQELAATRKTGLLALYRKVKAPVDSFNEWLALKLSAGFSTMACAYAFTVLVVIPFIFPSTMQVVQFISSGFLQLVALPLIGVSGVIVGRASDAAREEDHAALMAEVAMMREELAVSRSNEAKLDAILRHLGIEPPPGATA